MPKRSSKRASKHAPKHAPSANEAPQNMNEDATKERRDAQARINRLEKEVLRQQDALTKTIDFQGQKRPFYTFIFKYQCNQARLIDERHTSPEAFNMLVRLYRMHPLISAYPRDVRDSADALDAAEGITPEAREARFREVATGELDLDQLDFVDE